MRILIHDYPGHAFPVQLSRELAHRRHDVSHIYAGYNVTPRGDLTLKRTDSDTLSIAPVFIREPLQKYSFFKRRLQEREYGKLIAERVKQFNPDIVISSQTPLDAQYFFQQASINYQSRFVFWLQDVIGIATQRILDKKYSTLGKFIGSYYINLEQKLLKKSDHIILITEDFQSLMSEWSIPKDRMSVIPNWSPVDNIPVLTKTNPWAVENELADKFCFIYTGTMGMKHNPDVLLKLSIHFRDQEKVRIVVVSEGPGADWLKEKKQADNLDNLIIMPYQSFDKYPEILGAADVLIALLEQDAGIYSVPSKVLSYLCAKRPLLLAVPQENSSAKIVLDHNAGYVVSPKDHPAFISASEKLYYDQSLRNEFGMNGRAYAEEHFNIKSIADSFESILERL